MVIYSVLVRHCVTASRWRVHTPDINSGDWRDGIYFQFSFQTEFQLYQCEVRSNLLLRVSTMFLDAIIVRFNFPNIIELCAPPCAPSGTFHYSLMTSVDNVGVRRYD